MLQLRWNVDSRVSLDLYNKVFRGCYFLFLVFTSLVNTGNLEAQKISISQKVEINLRKDDFAVAGRYQDFNVLYRRHYNESDMLFYDSAGIIKRRVQIPSLNNDCTNLQFQCNKNALCLYYEEKVGQKQILKAVRLLADSFFSEPKEIGSYERSLFKEKNEFQFAMSEDQSKVLCYTYSLNSDNLALQAYVLNEQLVAISEVSQLFDRNTTRMLFSHAVYNNGNAQLLCTSDLDVRGSSADVSVLECMAGHTTFTSITLPVKDKYFSELLLFPDNNTGTSHVAGYYSEGKFSGPKGIYYTKLNTSLANEQQGIFIPISLRFSRNRMDLRDQHLKALSLLSNGNLEIITEKFYKSTRMISSSPMPGLSTGNIINPTMDYSRSITEYNYDEITIFQITPEGKLKWNQNVLKSQQSSDDGGIYSSYGVLESKLGKVYVFNDINRRSDKLMAAYLSSKGILSMKQLASAEDVDNLEIMPRSAVQTGANEIVMPCTSKSYLCLLKIQY